MKKLTVSLLGTVIVLPGLLGYNGPVLQATSFSGTPSVTSTSTDQSSNETSSFDANTSSVEQQKLLEEAEISKEQAIKIATDFVDIPTGYKQDNVSFQTNWYGNNSSVWSISWSKQDDKSYGYINVTLDANSGDIVGMNRSLSDPDLEASYPPKVDRSEAKEIALSLIKEQFPDIQDKIKYEEVNEKTPLRGNVVYNLRFNHVVNDIPFRENFLELRVNGNGDLVGLNYRWDNNAEFPPADGVLSQAEAVAQMKETFPIRLQYRLIPGMNRYAETLPNDEKDKYALEYAYRNLIYGAYFDAKQGTWVDQKGNPLDLNQIEANTPVTAEALAEAPASGKGLTQQQALEAFKSYVDLPADMELEHASYHERSNNGEEAFWNFEWRNEKSSAFTYGRVDASTGELVEFNNYSYMPSTDEVNQVLTYEQAEVKAIEAVKDLVPWKTNQIALEPSEKMTSVELERMREFRFNFQRLVNGVPVPNQNINVTFSSETGELIRFYQNWRKNAEFPNPSSVITKEEAKDIYFDSMDIQLEYIQPYQEYYYPMETVEEDEDEAKIALAYEFRMTDADEPVFLDATRGAWVSEETGEPIVDMPEPTDITGHWAEQALRLMIEYRAINVNEDGEVNPNDVVTRGEVVKMLMLSSNPNPYYYKEMAMKAAGGDATFSDVGADSAYFPYVETAAREGLIDTSVEEFNPEAPVTREELADMIVRALDYEKIAVVDSMFNIEFEDASAIESPGTVAIVSHLGIMVGSKNKFRPDEHVTRAQAAQTYYSYLEKRGKYGRY